MNITSFENEDIWKGIILFGLNAATYKMALAKGLLDFVRQGQSHITWEELSRSFLKQYQDRLKSVQSPQQGNPHRMTVMERVVKALDAEAMDFTEALDVIGTKGLDNVIPRFQTIGRDSDIVKDYFYEYEFGNRLILKDSLLGFDSEQIDALENELLARWSLLEGAFIINQDGFELANDIREIYLTSGYKRTALTNNIPFLSGYQGNVCFYCGEPMDSEVHVDHVLPRQVLHHDEVWNLVLAHADCNLLKSDKLVGPHFIEKLIARNENIMGSNHPWKQKITSQLGATPQKRMTSLQHQYDSVKSVLGAYWWGGAQSYNPSTDPFYRKLITALNNP